ncbi:uncharacterized protein LOC123319436 isoform X1 [Coccinella septempunctata]|uniref:uncharacterized protein LOC123319436 isoform X1 n=1 Tax=Coccinella septempunctata TaxID=41139 RepID=UPI001D05CE2E|nr:uncharacterized protein LOC123319436 isoform X1 [Coccinella septempunctata]
MENNPDSTPDLFFCTRNIRSNIENINLTPDIGAEHLAIEFTVDMLRKPMEYSQETKMLYEKCNIGEVNKQVSQILGSLQGSRNPKRTNILEIHQKTVEIHDSQFHPINSSSRKNFD